MTPFTRCALATVLVLSGLLAGCGETPENLVASAKDYLAKKDDKAAVIQLRNALQENPDLAEARFLLGKTLLAGGDVPGAEKELRRALQLQYPADEVAPLLARVLVMLGQYKDVIGELARVPVQTPQSKAELLTSIGEAYLALKNREAAQQAYRLALMVQPNHVPAHLGDARVAASGGNLTDAANAVDAALAIAPNDPEAWHLKGDILITRRQVEPALVAYRKALEAKLDFLPSHAAIVAVLIQENRLDDAKKQFAALKQIAPRYSQTLYLEALLAYRQKNLTVARQAIQQQLRAVPDDLRGLTLAGAIELDMKSYAQAEVHLMKALDRAPGLRLTRRALIVSYVRSGQATQALETLKPILNSIDDDSNMLALAGEVFIVNGDPRRAAEYFAKAAALDPRDARKRTAVALTHVSLGDSDRAMRELEETAAADTGFRADLALIAGHMHRGEHDKALNAVARLEKKQPGEPLPLVLRGRILLAKKDIAGARRSFEQALQGNATYYPAAASLAELDLADGKRDAARQRFENLLAKDPSHVQALLALAAVRAESAKVLSGTAKDSESEQVVTLIRKAISAQPTATAPRLALITYYLSTKDPKQATAASQEALSVMADRPEILDAAGHAYQAAGDTFQALTAYKRLATLQRSSPEPYLRIAEVQWAAKNKDDARDSLRKALEIKPDLIDAQRAMIALHLDADRQKEALAVAREVQKQRRKEPVGYALEGDIYARQKSWAEAASAYRAGLTQTGSSDLAARLHATLSASGDAEAGRFAAAWLKDHPKDLGFRNHLAQTALATKDFNIAAQHYRKLLEVQPNNAVALNNLAYAEGQLKEAQAVEHAELANKLAPNQPAIMDTLGTLLVDKGDVVRGVEWLRKASDAAPQASSIRLNLAKALIKAGQKDAARKELDELSKLGNEFSAQSEVAQLKQAL